MQTLWFSPTEYTSGDPTLQISYPFTAHPGTLVTCTSPGDLKWVALGLRLPPNVKLTEVILCYQVSNPRSFISQVRLSEMSTPDQAFVRHDDGTDLTSTSPATYHSKVNSFAPTAAVTLELRLNYQNTADQIVLGAVGITLQPTAALWANVKDYGAKGDLSVDDSGAIQTALNQNPCVVVPPGEYRIDQRLDVTQTLYLLPGATLIRKQASPSTEPVVLLTNAYATLAGGGWVITENNSPRGVVCVGPRDPNVLQNIIWTRIDGIKIKGVSTDSNNVGLNLDSTEPIIKAGANYNGSFSNLVIREVAIGVKLNPICNGHTFSNLFFYALTRYSYWAVKNSENTFYGGFTHHSSNVTIIKLEGCGYNLFYGVQGEPGGQDAHYIDVDQNSKVCQILGHDSCIGAPLNQSESLTYLTHGYLSVVNLTATRHEARPLSDPPYKPIPLQGAAQPDSTATTVEQLQADFNALLSKLRTSGAIAS